MPHWAYIVLTVGVIAVAAIAGVVGFGYLLLWCLRTEGKGMRQPLDGLSPPDKADRGRRGE